MIYFLSGKIVEFGKNFVILEVSGVGYRIYMPEKIINNIAKNLFGVKKFKKSKSIKKLKVFTKLIFNQHEGTFDIFGFLEKDSLKIFELLISVTGVGPKVALNILSSVSISQLISAITNENIDYLRKISGLGLKTAQRLVIELKDRINKFEFNKFKKEIDLNKELQVIDALMSFGYSKGQVREALRKAERKKASLEDIIKEVLKILGSTG